MFWKQTLMLFLLFGVTGITIAASFLMPFTATDNENEHCYRSPGHPYALVFVIALQSIDPIW